MESYESEVSSKLLNHQFGSSDPFAAAVRATRMAMVITDPCLADNPIIFVNDSFLKLTGYDREEILGKNCRFLQGPETDTDATKKIAHAIENLNDIHVDILNYRKDNTSFWNALYISPVFDNHGKLIYYFASQIDVTERVTNKKQIEDAKVHFEQQFAIKRQKLKKEMELKTILLHEVDHRVKNNLQIISSLIAMQMRTLNQSDLKQSLGVVQKHVDALSTVHRHLYHVQHVSNFHVSDFIRDLVHDLLSTTDTDVQLQFELDDVVVDADQATPLALVLNEIIAHHIDHYLKLPKGAHPELKFSLSKKEGHCHIKLIYPLTETLTLASGYYNPKLVSILARQLSASINNTLDKSAGIIEVVFPIVSRVNSEARGNSDAG